VTARVISQGPRGTDSEIPPSSVAKNEALHTRAIDAEKSGPGLQEEGVRIVHSDEVECGEESTMTDERWTRGNWVKISEDVLCIVLCAGIT
jgi:hypothetical protein